MDNIENIEKNLTGSSALSAMEYQNPFAVKLQSGITGRKLPIIPFVSVTASGTRSNRILS